MIRSIAALVVLIASQDALAACDAPYTHAQWKTEMDAVDESLASFNLEVAREQLVAVHKGVLCLDTVAQPSYVARVARQFTLVFFFDQDQAAASRWGLGSRFAYPDLPWPSDIGEDHVLRQALAEVEMPGVAGPDDKGLIVPKKGVAFVDGRLMQSMKVPIEVPVLVQIADKDGLITREYWQDGSAWPDDLLGPPIAAFVAPTWYKPETADKVAQIKSPLWGAPDVASAEGDDVVAVAPPPPPQPPPPPPKEVIPEGVPVAVAGTASLEAYVDPFVDARMRAIVKERSVRTEVDASTGQTRTITTEVVTFVGEGGAAGAVKASDFADWIAYRPEWQRDAAIAAGRADKSYLKSWVGGVQPGAPTDPAVWVSFLAAKAYCDDWSKGLADVSVEAPPAKVDEWRQIKGDPALRPLKGAAAAYTGDLTRTSETTGFRCVD